MTEKEQIRDLKFIELLKQRTGYEFQQEYIFHPFRRWRFDFSNIDLKIAIEVDGAIWAGGRHTRGAGHVTDAEKINTATLMGWKVLRTNPQKMFEEEFLFMVEVIVKADISTEAIQELEIIRKSAKTVRQQKKQEQLRKAVERYNANLLKEHRKKEREAKKLEKEAAKKDKIKL